MSDRISDLFGGLVEDVAETTKYGVIVLAREHILIDKTELVLIVPSKNSVSVVNLTYDQIVSITIEKYTERSLFRSFESERILIKSRKTEAPYVYNMSKEKQHFGSYKAGLIEFAKRNHVSLAVNT